MRLKNACSYREQSNDCTRSTRDNWATASYGLTGLNFRMPEALGVPLHNAIL